MPNDKYGPQKRYLAKRKELRVSMDAEKYELFKSIVHANNQSIYALINDFVDNYIKENKPN